MEVTFFTAASMVLSFGPVTEAASLTQQRFGWRWARACTASGLFLFPTLPPQWVAGGWARAWEGTQLGRPTRTDRRHAPCYMTSRSAIKAQGKEAEGQMVVVMAFVCFPKQALQMLRPCPSGGGWTSPLPASGKQRNSSFALPVCAAFVSPIKLSLPQSTRLLAILLPSPQERGGSKRLGGFGCWPQ